MGTHSRLSQPRTVTELAQRNPAEAYGRGRECLPYIGTETEVPAPLAARFATTFFSFLYGAAGRGIAPVGEAIAQARRFLWTEYQNIGGLFYNYVNDYALYAADDQIVAGLRRHDDSEEQ
jgi:hypothetical protein